MEETIIEQWGIVEILGHVKMAGRITEEERFGSKLGRVDIPDGDKFVTVYFGGDSLYRFTSVSEEVARIVAKSNQPTPVFSWEISSERRLRMAWMRRSAWQFHFSQSRK